MIIFHDPSTTPCDPHDAHTQNVSGRDPQFPGLTPLASCFTRRPTVDTPVSLLDCSHAAIIVIKLSRGRRSLGGRHQQVRSVGIFDYDILRASRAQVRYDYVVITRAKSRPLDNAFL